LYLKEFTLKFLKNLGSVHIIMLPGIGIFISAGTIMKVLVPYLRAKGFKVDSVWAQTQEAAREAAEELEISFFTSKVDDVLLKREVDLIIIMCPPLLHAQIAVKALGIGKHVLCDKPGGLSQSETLKMVHAAQYYPSLISVMAYSLRFLPSFQYVRNVISDQLIGEVNYCDIHVQLGSLINPKKYVYISCFH
jgi:predicted dehydrogenase